MNSALPLDLDLLAGSEQPYRWFCGYCVQGPPGYLLLNTPQSHFRLFISFYNASTNKIIIRAYNTYNKEISRKRGLS